MYVEIKYLIYLKKNNSSVSQKKILLCLHFSYPKLVAALEKKPSPSDYKSGWKYLSVKLIMSYIQKIEIDWKNNLPNKLLEKNF